MKTSVDYLRVRTLSNPFQVLEAIRPAFGTAADLVGFGDQVKGVDGWTYRRPILMAGDVCLGAIDYGGHHMRGVVRLDLPGSGCEWVQDWGVMANLPKVLQEAAIKRLDLALTTHQGEVTHEAVIAAHEARQFGTGGRHPHRKVVDGSDPRAGRTMYVGKRTAWKFGRFYEKGWELLKDVPCSVRDLVRQIELDGVGLVDPAKVYRCEVEFKAVDGVVIPWEAITDRDNYFAGAYPFLATLIPSAIPHRVQSIPKLAPQLALASGIENVRRSYGATVRAIYEATGRDAQRTLDLLMAEKPCRHLVEAGVLTLAETV